MIYLDNAATTLKKPYFVRRECRRCLRSYCTNSGRGGHWAAMRASEKIFECRENLGQLFSVSDPSRIVFTQNATAALNQAISGILKPGDHAVVTAYEHNSVLRPLARSGASYTVVEPAGNGLIRPADIEAAVTDSTRMIITSHASNVTGAVCPIFEIGQIAKRHGLLFLVDTAQSAGILDISAGEDNISLLAFTGHKLLYGPTGTGGLYIAPGVDPAPLLTGGTGSLSESEVQPDFLPDRYESGTLNTLGLAGLSEGVAFVLKQTPGQLLAHERELRRRLLDGIYDIPGIRIMESEKGVGILSLALPGMDSVTAAELLDERYGIACRGGLHCSALAHRFLGTCETGLIRFSPSFFTTKKEIDKTAKALRELAKTIV